MSSHPEPRHHDHDIRLVAEDLNNSLLNDKVQALRAGLFERLTVLSEDDASLCFEPFLALETICRDEAAFRIFGELLHQCNSNMDNSLIEMLGFVNRIIPMIEKLSPGQRAVILNNIQHTAQATQTPEH